VSLIRYVKNYFAGFPETAFYGPPSAEYTKTAKTMGLFFVVALVLLYAVTIHSPLDDALRSVVAWRYDFNYQKLYGADQFPFNFDPWYPYEAFLAFLQLDLGFSKVGALQFFQGLSLALFVLGGFLFGYGRIHIANTIAAVGIVVTPLLFRFTAARPDILEAALFIILLALVKNGTGSAAKMFVAAALSLFIGLFYHFGWIYLVPILLFEPYLAVAALTVSFFAWNYVLSGGEWLEWAMTLFRLDDLRHGIVVLENQTTIGYMAALAALVYAFARKQAESLGWRFWMVVLWFSLPNQMRYFATIVYPLVAFGIFSAIPKTKVPNPLLFVPLLFYAYIEIAGTYRPYPDPTHIPKGSTVICDNMSNMFRVVYANESELGKVVPPMEIGFAEEFYKRSVLDRMKGKGGGPLDCSVLRKHPFDYVVESSLSKVPECMELYEVNKNLRIWKYRKDGR